MRNGASIEEIGQRRVRDDYRVLKVSGDERLDLRQFSNSTMPADVLESAMSIYDRERPEPWSAGDTRMYVDGGYNGVLYDFLGFVRPDLEFLHDLPGLRYVEITGRVRDDTAVFRLPLLEELSLSTGCRRKMDLRGLPRLKRLGLTHSRRGLETISAVTGLEDLFMNSWKEPDLCLLAGAPKLRRLSLEGRDGELSLHGLEGCLHLRLLELHRFRYRSFAPLRGLRRLEEVLISGDVRQPDASFVDLSDLADAAGLTRISVNNCHVPSAARC